MIMQNMSMAGFDRSDDSLERIELRLAMEEALIEKICADERLSLDAREELIREILARRESDEFWNGDDWNDDDASAILVRRLGPKGPKGQSGIAVRPEVESDGILEANPEIHARRSYDRTGDTAGV